MAWDGKKLPDALASSATAAANAAGNGSKNAAYLTHIQTAIGSAYKRQLFRDEVRVWEATASGTLPISGSTITLPLTATENSISTADIDTGEWVHYIVKAADASSSVPTQNYIATKVTKTGGAGPAFLTADLDSAGDVVLGSFVLNSPSFDTVVTTPNTLAEAYATCMTAENDFPPGNLENTTWPSSRQFTVSPWGSNVDQMHTDGAVPATVQEGRVVPIGANRILGWCWFMPRKLALTPTGNWRIQFRDIQFAVKVDSLSNPWNRYFGPVSPDPGYGLNNLGGLRLSGNIANSANTTLIRPFDMNQNPLEARVEPTGGVSIKNVGTRSEWFQVEINVPDGGEPQSLLPASATSDRTKAFAGVFWARLIKDVESGAAIPSNLEIGAMMGLDCYGPTGRIGNPGWSRIVRLTTDWKPIAMAFVLDPNDERYPMSRAQISAWLTANPPPFI